MESSSIIGQRDFNFSSGMRSDSHIDDLKNVINIDEFDRRYNTRLIQSILDNNPLVLGTVLFMGADPNLKTPNQKEAPIIIAAGIKNGAPLIKLLIDHGANIDEHSLHSRTALSTAAIAGNLDTVKVLLDNGADPHWKNLYQRTAEQLATNNGNHDIATYIGRFIKEKQAQSEQKSLLEAVTDVNADNLENLDEYGYPESIKTSRVRL